MSRLNGMSLLDRGFHDRLYTFVRHLQAEDNRFQIFETIRSPQRQDELYAIGRDPNAAHFGKHVTNAMGYQSPHPWGLAADIWPCVGGQWEWIKADDPRWQTLLDLAPQFGLETLSWERPHVQLEGFRFEDEKPGPMDTEGWLRWLEQRNGGTT